MTSRSVLISIVPMLLCGLGCQTLEFQTLGFQTLGPESMNGKQPIHQADVLLDVGSTDRLLENTLSQVESVVSASGEGAFENSPVDLPELSARPSCPEGEVLSPRVPGAGTQSAVVRTVAFNEADAILADQDEASFGALMETGTTELQSVTGTFQSVTDENLASNLVSERGPSLQELEALAIASHPAIAQAHANIRSAQGQFVQAGLSPNPVLQYQSEEIGNEDSTGLHSVTLSQQFVTAGKLGIAQQVQAHEMARRRAQLRRTELVVLTGVRAAYANALIAQQRTELSQLIVELSEQSIESVEALFKAEEVSKISLLQAQVEGEQARIALANAQIVSQASRRSLIAAVGVDQIADGLLIGDPASGLSDRPWEELLGEIVGTSPEVAAAASGLERARWALQLACANVTPNVTGSIGVGVDAATDDTFATIGVSVPLPIRNRNQGNIQTARANIASASASIGRTRLDLQSRLSTAVERYQTARTRYTRLNDQVMPIAEETFGLSQKAFDAGETGFLQLLTAQRTLFSTRLSILDALAQAKQALAEIEGLLVTLES